MLANILVKYFEAGGPVMWPILITAIVAVAVVGERSFWWFRESRRRDAETLEKLFAALEAGDFREASQQSKDSNDPVIRMVWHGMNHFHFTQVAPDYNTLVDSLNQMRQALINAGIL